MEDLTSKSLSPPRASRGFQTRMSSAPYPSSYPVLRPRCWSGKNSTLSPRPASRAQVSTARAFEEVQTAPAWRPTNAFSAAEEFM